MCDVNYSVLLLRISFRIYTSPSVCHAIEKDNAAWVSYLIVVLNFSFLCGSYVFCIWVERNTPFCYVYHFVPIYCVFHVYIMCVRFALEGNYRR